MANVTKLMLAEVMLGAILCAPARSGVIVSEAFDYGAAAGAIDGRNGGVGFSSAWSSSADFRYNPTGLTFGSLQVSGGSVSYDSTGNTFTTNAARQFDSELSGTIHGSYLFRVDGRSDVGNNLSVLLTSAADQSDLDAPLWLSTPTNGTGPAQAAIHDADPSGVYENFVVASTDFEIGTTYLALFKLVPGATTTASAWILTSG